VLADQRVFRLCVIEFNVLPGLFDVAIAALFAELTVVIIVVFVAADAVSGSVAKFFVRQMAICALGIDMRKLQVKIRLLMIEVTLIQLDNVSATTDMICMTFCAIDSVNFVG
jgi:hypothetical protein